MVHDKNTEIARRIAEAVAAESGTVYFVGGCVRDELLGIDGKDIDIEVHGIAPDRLEEILDSLGEKITVGVSFGIYGLKGYKLDIAMPRRETATGKGHRDFQVFVDPFIGTLGAAKRRDFTVNALMKNVITGELVDHFGGMADLRDGIIRHVNDDSFAEDPLRVLRAAGFAARFGFAVADETVRLCRGIDISSLSKERIEGELKKALLKGKRPSVFFGELRRMGKLDEWFPEVRDIIGVEQSPVHHAEGDVWNHTMMVLDEAAAFRDRVEDPFGFMLAALVHDFGKTVTTEAVNGAIHAYGHETAGIPIARTFLSRITGDVRLIRYALNLAEYHMKPGVLAKSGSSVKSTNKMFDAAIDPEALICIAMADSLGRIAKSGGVTDESFLRERLAVYREYMSRPYVAGRDLIEAGLTPDERFSEILAYAHKLRLAGVEKESALKQTLAFARKLK